MLDRIFSRMPVTVVGAVIKIDQVHCGHAGIEERNVVVIDSSRSIQELLRVPEAVGGSEHDIRQPRCGTSLAMNIQIGITNHIHQDHCLDAPQFARGG